MKKIILFAGIGILIIAISVGMVFKMLNRNNPDVLLKQLRLGGGDREELMMRFNLARGDSVPYLVAAYESAADDEAFRTVLVELLFNSYQRSPDDRVHQVLKKALADPSGAIREQVVLGYDVYIGGKALKDLLPLLDDSQSAVRRYLCLSLTQKSDEKEGLWELLTEEERDAVIAKVQNQLTAESNESMKFLLRSVVGRGVFSLCEKARQLQQKSDLAGAEELYQRAINLDTQNVRATNGLARFYLDTGREELALDTAKRYDALLSIPQLSRAPEVDGVVDDAVWAEAYSSERFFLSNSIWVDRPAEGRSKMMVGHFEGRIYIAVLGYEDDLDELSIRHRQRDSQVWRDDCAELFLAPDHDTRNVYQFVINPIGVLFDAQRRNTRHNTPCEAAGAIFKDKGYWAAEFSVEGAELNKKVLKSGDIWTMNVMRTRIGAGSEQCAWWPTYGYSHQYVNYPIAVFE